MNQNIIRSASTAKQDTDFPATILNGWEHTISQIDLLEEPPINLTSASGTLPIRVGNAGDQPVKVTISVFSPGLNFPSGSTATITVPPTGIKRYELEVTAKNPGGLTPVIVRLSDPATGKVMQEMTFPVRSSAYPLTALLAIGGGMLVFLAKLFQRNRAKAHPVSEVSTD